MEIEEEMDGVMIKKPIHLQRGTMANALYEIRKALIETPFSQKRFDEAVEYLKEVNDELDGGLLGLTRRMLINLIEYPRMFGIDIDGEKVGDAMVKRINEALVYSKVLKSDYIRGTIYYKFR